MAAYDSDVTSSVLSLDIKRRTFRVDFQRPELTGEGGGDVYANGYLREDAINTTSGSATSGSVIAESRWLITINKQQIQSLDGYAQFVPALITLFDDLKTEYDASGSLATGSIKPIV